MGHEIITEISKEAGKVDVKVTVKGVKGRSCKTLTKDLEKEFGVVSDTPTREMHEQERVAVRARG